jgi:hypothetical protein
MKGETRQEAGPKPSALGLALGWTLDGSEGRGRGAVAEAALVEAPDGTSGILGCCGASCAFVCVDGRTILVRGTPMYGESAGEVDSGACPTAVEPPGGKAKSVRRPSMSFSICTPCFSIAPRLLTNQSHTPSWAGSSHQVLHPRANPPGRLHTNPAHCVRAASRPLCP